ncbi:MAG TPA: ferritin-like fold-containing protein, partial [Nakamurella sp.]|nr:ferritin-like fold-containing protein [Nakamurella sp.]
MVMSAVRRTRHQGSPSRTGGILDGVVMTDAQRAARTRKHPPEQAVIDLLGVLAYGELSAFDRMAADAR